MNTYETTALHVTNGMKVRLFGVDFKVTAAHYAGPIDGSGTTVLEFGRAREWEGPASTVMQVVG